MVQSFSGSSPELVQNPELLVLYEGSLLSAKPEMIFKLKHFSHTLTGILGGKSAATALMNDLGIPCPPSVALPVSAFFEYMNGLDPREKICQSLRPFLDRFSKNQKFILRSSAIGEDSANHSFAGQFDSLVTDPDESSLTLNLGRVWDSFFSRRSQAYQRKKNVVLPGMGVLIQPFLPAQYSGILFTRDHRPTTRGSMLLEYHAGGGEEIVQGKVIPEQITIRQAAGRPIFSGPGAGAIKKNHRLIASLNELVRHARTLEHHTGLPQDIEWVCTDQGKLFLVQARPISIPPVSREKYLWSNTNVNENFPEPVVPFIESFAVKGYEYYFRNLGRTFGFPQHALVRLETAFRGIIGFHRRFMYYNLSHIYRTFHYFPFPGALRNYWDIFIGVYGKTAAKAAVAKTNLSRWERLRIVCGMTIAFMFSPLRVRRFENRVNQQILAAPSKIPHLDAQQQWIRGFLNLRFHRWLDASLADAAAMFSYGLLRQFLKNHGQGKKLNILLAGIPNLISHEPQVHLWDLSENIRSQPELLKKFFKSPGRGAWRALQRPENTHVLKQFKNYQKVWGHRISGELLMTRPDFREKPSALLDLIRGYLANPSPSPALILREKTEEGRKTAREIKTQLYHRHGLWKGFWKTRLFQFLMAASHTGLRARERVRNQQARLYNACRHTLLAIGRLFQEKKVVRDPCDALFLETSEILSPALFCQKKLLRKIISQRKEDWKKAFSRKPPDQFVLPVGGNVDTLPELRPQNPFEKKQSRLKVTQTLRGECASAGKVTGRARILRNVSEMKRLKPGEILVTRQTDPGWAPIFPLVKGLVIERGGMLSHGAIIAREYGIPALVAVSEATFKIPDGHLIILDAGKGKVSW